MDAAAEVPASGNADYINLVQRNVEQLPEQDAGVVEGLGRRPDGDPAVGFRTAGTAAGFHLAVVDPGSDELVLHDYLRLGKAFVYITLGHFAGAGDVVLDRDLLVLEVDLVVNQVVLCGHGLFYAEVGGQKLPLHLDGFGGLFGQFLGFRGHGSVGIADLAHMVAQDPPVFVG